MSKRARIPAPFRRLQPSVIRGLGPRAFLVASTATVLLLVGGSSYVLSRITQPMPAPRPQAKLSQPTPQDARVLGAATTSPNSNTPASNTGAAPTAPVQSVAATTTQAAAAPKSTGPICALTCIPGLSMPAPTPSFDLIVDSQAASKGLLSISLPFHVVRHGNLRAPIQPGSLSLTVGGSPTRLLRVQAVRMTDSDHGRITILNFGLPLSAPIYGQLTAQSAGVNASASFSL